MKTQRRRWSVVYWVEMSLKIRERFHIIWRILALSHLTLYYDTIVNRYFNMVRPPAMGEWVLWIFVDSSTWVLRRGWSWQWCVAEYRWCPATWRSPLTVSHWVKQPPPPPPAPASAGYNATEWNHNVLSLAARYQTSSRIGFCPLRGSSVRDFSLTVLLNVVCVESVSLKETWRTYFPAFLL